MRAHAAAFLSDVEARPHSPEAGVAHRNGRNHALVRRRVCRAREHWNARWPFSNPARDDDLTFRFGQDTGVAAMLYLAFTSWPLGDIGRAVTSSRRRGTDRGPRPYRHPRIRENACGNVRTDARRRPARYAECGRTRPDSRVSTICRCGGRLRFFSRAGDAPKSGAPGGGLEDMRRGIELLREQNFLLFDGLLEDRACRS